MIDCRLRRVSDCRTTCAISSVFLPEQFMIRRPPPPLQYRDRHARIEQTRETWSKAGNDGTAPSEPPVCQYWSAISRQFGFTRSYCLWQCASHFLVGHTHTHTHTTQCLNHLQPRRMWCRLQCETDVIICIIHLTHLTDFEQSLIDFYFHFSI